MHAAANDAVNDQLVRHVELQHEVHVDAGFFHRVSLRNGAWETVQQEALAAIFLSDALFDQRDHQLIGHQLAGVHDLFRLLAQFTAGLHGCAQHITGGDLRNAVFLHDELSLSTFTSARSAQQNDTHCVNPLAM